MSRPIDPLDPDIDYQREAPRARPPPRQRPTSDIQQPFHQHPDLQLFQHPSEQQTSNANIASTSPTQPDQPTQPQNGLAQNVHPSAMKRIPYCNWAIILTSANQEYYLNLNSQEAVWDIPEEIADIIENLMVAAQGGMDDDDDDGGMGDVEMADQMDETSRKREREEEEDAASVAKKPRELTREEKELLKEKEVNPFSMWDTELPKIINDIRYTYIATLKERREIFDLYCKSRSEEIAAQRKSQIRDKKDAFIKLLEDETTIKTNWDDFQRKFKRDSRFMAMEPKEREAIFKDHMRNFKERELERKRAQTKANRDALLELLKSTRGIDPDSSWRRVQRDIEHDARYKAISSATEREDVFRQYVSTLKSERDAKIKDQEKADRVKAAVKEREEAVGREREMRSREIERARGGLRLEESVNVFRTLLVDAVRSHNVRYQTMLETLKKDARWSQAQLSDHDRQTLFDEHVDELYAKRLAGFHTLLDGICDLKSTFADIYPQIEDDPRVGRLEVDEAEMERLFSQYIVERRRRAEDDLREALRENNFIKFHVKTAVSNSEIKAVENKQQSTEADAWALVSLEEIKQVLKEDKRFLFMSSAATTRDDIVKNYLQHLIRESMAEKGGTRDLTISKFGGGMPQHDGHKSESQRWRSAEGSRRPNVSGSERKKGIMD
ncbi:hypothetical protein SmJEL517_g04509 [Synchytrium microbalum]|uniref:WW domain-containing protein n=1 Tax=Synchytrium microbalum TaxID=1806994 RepID=A0A507BY19_9FUNG|nr:uncharacterized protein SmJEL517_g04509 [Synchytrium microbalum]TPX32322.1 hypothetical protein SmJEL517_g04509 [Synchytrium microbalum]